jgi:peptidoglycan/LPS O-acetylase OafA/YrhL/lysophospholipase L1-like esterase
VPSAGSDAGSGINPQVGTTLAAPDGRSTSAAPEAASPAVEGPERGALGHRRGLDGLRGLAVVAVVVYHGGFSWAKGGFLGVSTFFTLSGFLITTLALDERRRTAGIDLRAFWRRRFRRLLPASLAAIALALVVALAVGDHTQRTNMPGDVAGALAYVANWRFLLADQSYGDLFADPSPLLHFWSLAIEEQFYLLFPLIVGGVWWLARRPGSQTTSGGERADHRRLAAVLGGLAVVSLAATLVGGFDHEHVYMGTVTRAFEILAGCLLAVGVHGLATRGWLDRRGPTQRGVAIAGAVTMGLAVVAWTTVAQSDDALYQGGLALYALASAVTVLAACLVAGPLPIVLRSRPLVRLGEISYGVYLYHWPIFLWLRQGTDWAIWPRFVVGVALALAAAEVSARVLERPVRSGRPLLGRRPWTLAAPVMAVLVLGALVVRAQAPAPTIDFAAAQRTLNAAPASSTPPAATEAGAAPRARVAFFGDSTALLTGEGFAAWLQATGRGDVVPGSADLGCSLMGGDQLRLGGAVGPGAGGCTDWASEWPAAVAEHQPTTVVVQLGAWDVQERRIGDDPTWRGPGDPVFDKEMRTRLLEVVDLLSSHGATVVWLRSPTPTEGREGRASDPAYDAVAPRIQRINELIDELPAQRPGAVRVVDLSGWFESTGDQERLRPDGMHFSATTSREVADRFLGEAVLGSADWNRPDAPPGGG